MIHMRTCALRLTYALLGATFTWAGPVLAGATLSILHPPDGATFEAPANIVIEATAVDPLGDIRHVEFFANGNRIGASDFLSKIAVIPGRPIPHRFTWAGVPAGTYRLLARAKDTASNPVESAPVEVVVKRRANPVVVNVRAEKSEAYEAGDSRSRSLVFRFVRSGAVDFDLPVYFALRGTAANGTDYAKQGNSIVIPKAAEATTLVIEAIPDALEEPEETVVLTLEAPNCIAIYPPPPECYRVGELAEAKGVIRDVPAPPVEGTRLVRSGSTWRYYYGQPAPPSEWLTPGFDDAGWRSGPAQLGYGDGDEATVITDAAGTKPITAYFRFAFDVADSLEVDRLLVSLVRDDGAVVYLNGQELLRDNMPDGVIGPETPAASTTPEENKARTFQATAAALVKGRNLLAVEVHQANAASSDLSFDLELLGVTKPPAPDRPVVSIVATRPETVEPSPETRIIPGLLTLARTGAVSEPLHVTCRFHGSAEQGKDYELDPKPGEFSTITIPAGAASVEVVVMPLDDELVEGDENVVAELVSRSAADPVAGAYLIDPERALAKVVIHDNDTAPPPTATLVIDRPADGARFVAPRAIELEATAIDPKGYISRVEFWANEKLLGVSEIVFVRAPDPGTPIHHEFLWKEPPLGSQTLFAAAVDSAGAAVKSAPVRIVVEPAFEPIVVEVVATDSEAKEGIAADGSIDTATFTLHRRGRTDLDLPVFYRVGGTATNGKDYDALEGKVVLPKDQESVSLSVRPIDDPLAEETESVVVVVVPPACIEIFPPPPECYQVGPAREARAVILDNDPPENRPPAVRLVRPPDGASFEQGTAIVLVAQANDPDGADTVKQVEFFAGDRSLGVRENLPVLNPLGPYVLEWTDAPVGEHKLTAVATDNQGATGVSTAVVIKVTPAAALPVVTIEAVDAEAREPRHSRVEPNIGSFLIQRTGDVRQALEVTYAVEGTAINGTDYRSLDGTAVLRAGERSRRIHVVPRADALVEGTETVVLKLKAGTAYELGTPAEATVKILDATPTPPAIATLEITKPTNGTRYTAPAEIQIEATAVDPQGYISRVEFYANRERIGVSQLEFLIAPPDGTPIEHVFVWKAVPAGIYVLTARALDHAEKPVISAPVLIVVRRTSTAAFVIRDLPPAYVPGTPFHVLLRAQPPEGTHAYAVEDQPPKGWAVADVSDEGSFDAATGKVKFGPFTDARDRTLQYQVTPPAEASGTAAFEGLASANDQTTPVGGDHVIDVVAPRHPADLTRADFRLEIHEVAAYAAAWRAGVPWPVDPNPIPPGYVTRAALLWHEGELYRYDPAAGAPPACWLSGTGALGIESPEGDATSVGSAVAVLPTPYESGHPLTVIIQVRPSSRNVAYAVEEQLPAGWRVSAASHDAAINAGHGVIRWGPFLDSLPRDLTYTALAPEGAASDAPFAGRVAFDGHTLSIAGARRVADDSVSEPAPASAAVPVAGGALLVGLPISPAGECVLEFSTDLLDWEPLASTVAEDGWVSFLDNQAPSRPMGFYRVVPIR